MTEAELTHWLVVGQTAQEEGRFGDAARAFIQVRDALPGVFAVARMAADAWRLAGDVVQERDALQVAYACSASEDVPTRFDLGAALLTAGAPTEALACFEAVAVQRPHDPAVLGARAGALRASGQPEAAWPLIERAVRAAPANAALLLTAAQIRHALGDLPGALQWLDRAEAVRPAHAPTRLQRALTSLLGGVSAEGWALFEHRALPSSGRAQPWHGESLEGESIVVLADQGVGDQFHFVRYLAALRARGTTRVTLAAAPPTVRLFQASGFDAVPVHEAPEARWEVPLLSLPHRLGLSADYGASTPYLYTEGRDRARGGRPMAPEALPRVGLVWKGNPAFGSTVLRDFDAALLPALLATPGIHWVWLQYGEAPPGELATVEQPTLAGDWLDTARVLETLDAVVSVDTGLAHLAGAMGIPGFVLLPHAPDWRWGLSGTDTPWYPSLTLLRQPAPRDWVSVLRALQERLVARDFPGDVSAR